MLISAPPKPLTQQLFNCRECIPFCPSALWRIERGVVRTITWSEDNSLSGLGYWGPGDIVGHPLSRLKPYEIECLTSVEMSILPSELWYQSLDAILLHIQQTEELLSILHQKPISQRLWRFLVWLGQKFGRDVDQGRLIDLQLTHQDLAESISLTRVTVTRLLKNLKEQGKLDPHHRQLVIAASQAEEATLGELSLQVTHACTPASKASMQFNADCV